MLQEIGRRAGQSGSGQNAAGVCAASHDREGYALAAGMALGLITLGKGDLALGLTGSTLPSLTSPLSLSFTTLRRVSPSNDSGW
jgi:anaphase-promoting complex subunit 1